MTKQQVYQSEATAALQLTAQERQVAKELLGNRPEVMRGTRVIVNRAEAVAWFNTVTKQMRALGIDQDPNKVRSFCDLAGVPD